MSRRAAAADSKRVTWSRWGTSGWRSVERLSAGLAPGQLPQLRGCHCPARPWAERGRGGQCPGEDEPARGRRLQRHGLFAPHPKENEVVRWGSDFTRTEARIALDG